MTFLLLLFRDFDVQMLLVVIIPVFSVRKVNTESHYDNENRSEHEQGKDAFPIRANVSMMLAFQNLLLAL